MESSGIIDNLKKSPTFNSAPIHEYELDGSVSELNRSEQSFISENISVNNISADEINIEARHANERRTKKTDAQKRADRYMRLRETANMVHLKMDLFVKSTSFFGNSSLLSDAKMKIGYFLESTKTLMTFSDNVEENKVILNRSIDVMMAYLSQAIDSCNMYMLGQKNSDENSDKYKKISNICSDLAYELQELNTQKNAIANGCFDFNLVKGRKLVASDFIVAEQPITENVVEKEVDAESGVTNYTINGKKCKLIDADRFRSADRQADTRLASALGLMPDDFATQYAHYHDKDTKEDKFLELPETGKTLADINKDGLDVEMSSRAHSKLQQIYLFDLLRGKKRDANNIKVSFLKLPIEGLNKFKYIIKDVKMTGEPGNVAEAREITKGDVHNLDNDSKERIRKLAKKIEKGDSNFVNSLLHENATEDEKRILQNRITQIRDVIDTEVENRIRLGAYGSLIRVNAFGVVPNDNYAVDERDAIESTMDATCAMSFAAKHKKGPGSGRAGRIFNKVRHIFSVPNHIVNFVLWGGRKLINCILPSNDRSFDSKERKLQTVPGKLHSTELFDNQKKIKEDIERGDDDQEVMDDKRYMPLAFEQAIPDETNKPPYVTLKVNNGGHAFLEMSYTRLNKKTNQKQRYRVNFGFYGKMEALSTLSGISMAGSGVLLPGVIKNEEEGGKHCVAGKRFTVTNKQINRIVAFTHDFEKGGFNIANRNCAVFATEALKAAQIDSGNLFKKSTLTTAGYNAAGGVAAAVPVTGAITVATNSRFKRYGHKEDISYQTFGQSMISKEEYERLYSFHGTKMEAYNPQVFKENIEKQSINHGDIISYQHTLFIGQDEAGKDLQFDDMTLSKKLDYIDTAIETFTNNLKDRIGNDIPADKITDKTIALQSKLHRIEKEKLILERGQLTSDKLLELKRGVEECTKYVNDAISYCNEMYNEFFHADMRVQETMYVMVSTLNYLKEDIYSIYSENGLDAVNSHKVSDDMKIKALIQKNTNVILGKEKGKNARGKEIDVEKRSIDLSLREISASMEVFGSVNEYKDFLKRYAELITKKGKAEKKEAENQELNPEEIFTAQEERELKKLKMRRELVDTFIRVHQVYFDSKDVTEGLATMAFATMPEKEHGQELFFKWNNGTGKSSLFTSSSQLYQNECFSKIFDSVWTPGKNGEVKIPDGIAEATNKINEKIASDDEEITNQMETIFRAVSRAKKITANTPENAETVATSVYESIIKNYVWASVAYEYEKENSRAERTNINAIKKRNSGEYFFEEATNKNWINANLKKTIQDKYEAMMQRINAEWAVVENEQPVQEQ